MILRNAIIILTGAPIQLEPSDRPNFTGNTVVQKNVVPFSADADTKPPDFCRHMEDDAFLSAVRP
jgi:hypothetical protein